MCSVSSEGNILSTLGGYQDKCGGILSTVEDIRINLGYLEYREGVQYCGDVMSTMGIS